jgi:hypothetical protein
MSVRPRWAARAAILALAALGTLLVLDHQRLDSATMDEPFHALAGAEYVLSGTAWANLEHPPLVKLLAGMSEARAGVRAPSIPVPFSYKTAETPAHFAFSNAVDPDRLLRAARFPFPILFFVLVAAAGETALRRAGAAAGVGAALLLAFEPTLVAHAGLLHTDVAAALGFLSATVLAITALERRSLRLWAASGGALGLLLAAKFSGLFLFPVLTLAALVAVLADRKTQGAPRYRPLAGLLLAGAVALAAILGICQLAIRSMPRDQVEQSVRLFLTSRAVPPGRIETIAALSRLSPPAALYAAGVVGVAAQNQTGGGVNVLCGLVSVEGFPEYFPVALAVKCSLGFLALLAAALAAALVRRVRPSRFEGMLAATAFYLLLSGTWASYNIGVRHMLPMIPLLAVAASSLLVRALPVRAAAALLLGCGLLQAAETWSVHPHELSFFNAAAGGPASGEQWLNDSNLDWGQDLARLATSLPPLGIDERTLTVAYFGGDSVRYRLPRARLFEPVTGEVTPGLWAVSSYLLAAGPEAMACRGQARAAAGYQRLREAAGRGTLVGRVGYSISILKFAGREDSPR